MLNKRKLKLLKKHAKIAADLEFASIPGASSPKPGLKPEIALALIGAVETLTNALESQDHQPDPESMCKLCRAMAKVFEVEEA